ncbi:hypothetical protein [Methanospirillum sp.]|jgi:hypothetical protein|uniref:hypothetical protein n=1 Tax=Methanospirillum sp. TaxID=45200 RepID=UPI001BD6C6A7|nr:hypothetical protein [Methanospirillum sp.]
MNDYETKILQAAFKWYTGDELMGVMATLEKQGYTQNDLPWIFRDYNREVLIANNRYQDTYRPLGPLTDPCTISGEV